MLGRCFRYLDVHFENGVVIVLQIVMVCSLTYTAIVRYFITHPFFTGLSHKAEELALFSFIGFLYFGAVIAVRDNAHFRITAHFSLISEKYRKYAYIPGELLWQSFNVFMVYEGWLLARSALDFPEPSLSLQIPMWIVYFIIPVTFALTLYRLAQRHWHGAFGGPDV